MISNKLLIVSFGGGTNSTAMLCGFHKLDIKPDIIMFADTGGEKPETYKHIEIMSNICKKWWDIEINIVKTFYQGKFEGLEKNCLRSNTLPGLAYGSRSCSMKYKVDPQDRSIKRITKKLPYESLPVWKAIGFGIDETHRKKDSKFPNHWYCWYPLIEWNWDRQKCIKIIDEYNIQQPGKSSCFFCPAMKRSEVLELKEKHPDLLDRALYLEENAQKNIKTKRGLGGKQNLWKEWLNIKPEESKNFLDIEPHEIPCECID